MAGSTLRATAAPGAVHLSDLNGDSFIINLQTGQASETASEFTIANGTRFFFDRAEGILYRQPAGQQPTFFSYAPYSTMFAWDNRDAYMLGRVWPGDRFWITRVAL